MHCGKETLADGGEVYSLVSVLGQPYEASSFIDGETKRENVSFRKLGT